MPETYGSQQGRFLSDCFSCEAVFFLFFFLFFFFELQNHNVCFFFICSRKSIIVFFFFFFFIFVPFWSISSLLSSLFCPFFFLQEPPVSSLHLLSREPTQKSFQPVGDSALSFSNPVPIPPPVTVQDMARGGSQASSHRSDGGKGEVKGRLSMDASMDKAKLVELENQYTQLYVEDIDRERGERSCTLERWRERGGGGGENKYTQLYVGEMEGDRGER